MQYTPAHYLHKFLCKAYSAGIGDNVQVRSAWARVFQVDAASRDLVQNINMMEALCSRLGNLIFEEPQARDSTKKHYAEYIFNLRRVFSSLYFQNNWGTIKPLIAPQELETLEHIEDFLVLRCGLQEIPEGDLEELRRKFQDLYGDVKESGIEARLKKSLLFQIQKMLNCLAQYDVLGTQGVADGAESIIGSIWMNADVADKQKESGVLARMKNVMDECKYWVRSGGEIANGVRALSDGGFPDLPLIG